MNQKWNGVYVLVVGALHISILPNSSTTIVHKFWFQLKVNRSSRYKLGFWYCHFSNLILFVHIKEVEYTGSFLFYDENGELKCWHLQHLFCYSAPKNQLFSQCPLIMDQNLRLVLLSVMSQWSRNRDKQTERVFNNLSIKLVLNHPAMTY